MDSYSLKYIKSRYILKQIFDNLHKNKLLKILNNNKSIQEKIDINIYDYKKYFEEIEIEIEVKSKINNAENNFINISEKDKSYFHIYFNNNNIKEIKRKYFTKNDNVKKIKIIIDNEIKSLQEIFDSCYCIEKINFIKFNRKDINNMNCMFYGCKSLKEINFKNFNTDNVTDMSYMFSDCFFKKIGFN